MYKLILACIFGLLITTNICYAEIISLKDLENKKIGVFSRIADYATLIFRPAPHAMGGHSRISVTYYGVPEWNVSKELNTSLLTQLNSNIKADIFDLTKHKETINAQFYIEGYKVGPKYISYLSTLPELKNLDYLLIVFQPAGYSPDYVGSSPLIQIIASATGIGERVMAYGFNSGYTGGIKSFVSISFALVDLKKKSTVIYDTAFKSDSYNYQQDINDFKKRIIYKFIQDNVSEEEYFLKAKNIIFNSSFLETDKNNLRKILQDGFDGEYDDDLDFALQDLDLHLVTNILTTTGFAKKIVENGAPDFDKQLEKLQQAVAKEIVEKIISD